jgi:hypothetical protein
LGWVGVWGSGGGHLVFNLEVSENGIKDLVRGNCVVVIKVIISGCFFIDVETFYGVEVDAFLLKINYLHNVLHIFQ